MYEKEIKEASLAFTREDDLLKIIEKVCFDNGLPEDATWAIRECFLQK